MARGRKRIPHLTQKEIEVIELIADGKTDYEMSIILGVAESTIQGRLKRARMVADVVCRTQLACKAIRMGWIK